MIVICSAAAVVRIFVVPPPPPPHRTTDREQTSEQQMVPGSLVWYLCVCECAHPKRMCVCEYIRLAVFGSIPTTYIALRKGRFYSYMGLYARVFNSNNAADMHIRSAARRVPAAAAMGCEPVTSSTEYSIALILINRLRGANGLPARSDGLVPEERKCAIKLDQFRCGRDAARLTWRDNG